MSLARKHFWTVTARANGGSACPRKYGMNCIIPAPVSRSPDSGGGISDAEDRRRCPRSSKNERKASRIRSPSTAAVYRRPFTSRKVSPVLRITFLGPRGHRLHGTKVTDFHRRD